jgi:putative redox protein
MRFVAVTGSGRTLDYGDDAPVGEHSPVETVLSALAACSAMDVASILGKKRQVIETYEVVVEAVQREAYPQVYTRIDVIHDVAGPLVTEEALRRCVELSATKYCPVSAMLSAGETEIHHRYRVRGTGDVPFEAEGEVVVTGPYRRPDPIDVSGS